MLLLHKDQYKKRTRNAPTCTILRETKARIPRKHVEFDRTSIGTSFEEWNLCGLQFLHSLLQHQNLLLDTWHGLRGNGGNRISHASWHQFLNNGKSNESFLLQCSLRVGHALETPNSLSNETAQSKVDELNWSHYRTSSSSFSDFSTSASRNA